jgi:hypothetical protein
LSNAFDIGPLGGPAGIAVILHNVIVHSNPEYASVVWSTVTLKYITEPNQILLYLSGLQY